MSTFWLRLAWLVLGWAALLTSAFAFGSSAWGDPIAGFLVSGTPQLVFWVLVAGGLAWVTLRTPFFLGAVLIGLHLPGVLSQSSLDWARLLGWTRLAPDPLVSPWETAILALTTATLFSVAWRAAREDSYTTVRALGVDRTDREYYLRNNVRMLARVIGGSIAATGITMAVAFVLSTQASWMVGLAPWPVAMLGLATVGIASLVVYFLRLAWTDGPPPGSTGDSATVGRAPNFPRE